jgi:hypothetical protein
MKHLLLLTMLFFLCLNINGQGSIRIFTNLDEARFKILINGYQENTIPIKDIKFDTLKHNKNYKLVISFSSDTIADIEGEYTVLKNQHREFEILKKKEILRKSAKIGRKIGKALRIGSHEKEKILYDVFYLEERTKSEFMNN